MGMYDTFYFMGDAKKLVVCSEGHPMGDLQTKDLDCNLDTYYIGGPKIVFGPDKAILAFAFASRSGESIQNTEVSQVTGLTVDPERGIDATFKDTRLEVTRMNVYPFAADLNGEVTLYSSCKECVPVFYEERTSFMGRLGRQSPWCQWVARFEQGKLVEIRADRVETRETVQKKLAETGNLVLPDDDRVVKREIELWSKERH